MLTQRTLNAIALLHEAAGFKLLNDNVTMPEISKKERSKLIKVLQRKGYLDEEGSLRYTLDEISLFELLCDLEEKIDPCPRNSALFNEKGVLASESIKMLERTAQLWLKSIKLNQL